MEEYFHSVRLRSELCRGCTNCIKRCPTEAIRVRKSKATIINERCIDCGECIKICPHKAKQAVTDSIEMMGDFRYTIALPAPTLYAQFRGENIRPKVLSALKLLGFDDVYEVARAAEYVTLATRQYLKRDDIIKPVISCACPAVVRLIKVKYPSLIPNLLKLQSPMEVAARIAKIEFAKKRNVSIDDIGVFFISPCAAKMTSVKAPFENEKSWVDAVLPIKSVYFKLLNLLPKVGESQVEEMASFIGVRWANTGGEGLATDTDKFLAVDGIHNVARIFDEIEGDRLDDLDFIEALACNGGCLGGPLCIENVYVAKTKIKKILEEDKIREIIEPGEDVLPELGWKSEMSHNDILTLDKDISMAMKKVTIMDKICSELPGLDCGACGAPSCKALAEDIVRGNANETDCVFKLREKVRLLAKEMMDLEEKMPPVMDKDE